MITSLKGEITHIGEGFFEILCGAIGYKVFCIERMREGMSLGEEVEIFTHLHMREDDLSLYGFQTREERDFFEILLGVSGIGPKGGLGVLATAPVLLLKKAIASGDTSLLTRVSGIGQKKAQRIIIELKDKVGEIVGVGDKSLEETGDVIEALVGLGYSRYQAEQALRKVPEDIEGVEKKVKEALKILGK